MAESSTERERDLNRSIEIAVNRILPLVQNLQCVFSTSSPSNPSSRTYIARLSSFQGNPDNWSNLTHPAVSISSLAENGFINEGIRDIARCYHGNHVIDNWSQAIYDPGQIHAAWFPDCQFVKLQTPSYEIQEQRMKLAFMQDQYLFSTFPRNYSETAIREKIIELDFPDHFQYY